MILQRLIPPEHVFSDLRVNDKSRLLQELARRAGSVLGVPASDIELALCTREALGSTGVGVGIAVPHAQMPQLATQAAFLARLERPVDYQAVDDRPVDLVFLLLGPPAARAEHLAALAAATRRLRDPVAAAAMRTALSAAAMRDCFVAE